MRTRINVGTETYSYLFSFDGDSFMNPLTHWPSLNALNRKPRNKGNKHSQYLFESVHSPHQPYDWYHRMCRQKSRIPGSSLKSHYHHRSQVEREGGEGRDAIDCLPLIFFCSLANVTGQREAQYPPFHWSAGTFRGQICHEHHSSSWLRWFRWLLSDTWTNIHTFRRINPFNVRLLKGFNKSDRSLFMTRSKLGLLCSPPTTRFWIKKRRLVLFPQKCTEWTRILLIDVGDGPLMIRSLCVSLFMSTGTVNVIRVFSLI